MQRETDSESNELKKKRSETLKPKCKELLLYTLQTRELSLGLLLSIIEQITQFGDQFADLGSSPEAEAQVPAKGKSTKG